MTAQTPTVLKTFFQTGDTPTQAQFGDLIDSYLNFTTTTPQTIKSDVTVSGALSVTGTTAFSIVSAASLTANTASFASTVSANGNTFLTNATISTTASAADNTTKVANMSAVQAAILAGGGGTSSMVLLNTQTPTGVASFSFSSTYLTSTYKNYLVILNDLYGSINNVDLYMTISTNNGGAYLNTNYVNSSFFCNAGGTPTGAGSFTTNVNLTGASGIITNINTNLNDAKIHLFNPARSALFTCGWFIDGYGGAPLWGAARNLGTSPINNIQFALSSGTLTCIAKLYGIS